MYKRLLTLITGVFLLVILPTYLSFKFDGWFQNQDKTMIVLARGLLQLIPCAWIFYVAYASLKSRQRFANAQRGKAADIEDAFHVGNTVKVLALTRDKKYAILEGFHVTKFVRFNKPQDIQVGKHYDVDNDGKLIDLMDRRKQEFPASSEILTVANSA